MSRYLWTVRYRRVGWVYRQARYFKSESAARKFIERLEQPAWFGLKPIDHLTLEREPLGEVETLDSWDLRGDTKHWNREDE